MESFQKDQFGRMVLNTHAIPAIDLIGAMNETILENTDSSISGLTKELPCSTPLFPSAAPRFNKATQEMLNIRKKTWIPSTSDAENIFCSICGLGSKDTSKHTHRNWLYFHEFTNEWKSWIYLNFPSSRQLKNIVFGRYICSDHFEDNFNEVNANPYLLRMTGLTYSDPRNSITKVKCVDNAGPDESPEETICPISSTAAASDTDCISENSITIIIVEDAAGPSTDTTEKDPPPKKKLKGTPSKPTVTSALEISESPPSPPPTAPSSTPQTVPPTPPQTVPSASSPPQTAPVDWDSVELNIERDTKVGGDNEKESTSTATTNQDVCFRSSMFLVNKTHRWDCPLCIGKVFDKPELTAHLTVEHRKDGLCRICGKSYTSLTVMLEHMYLEHLSREERYWCCKAPWDTPITFSRHISLRHFVDPRIPVRSPFSRDWRVVCSICRTGFVYRTNLYQHLHTSHEIAVEDVFKVVIAFQMLHFQFIYTCTTCPRVFSEKPSEGHTLDTCSKIRDKYGMYTSFCGLCSDRRRKADNSQLEMPHVFSQRHMPYYRSRPELKVRRFLNTDQKNTFVCTFVGGERGPELELACPIPRCGQTFGYISFLTKHYISLHCHRHSTEVRIEDASNDAASPARPFKNRSRKWAKPS
eukprot:sb/3462908/